MSGLWRKRLMVAAGALGVGLAGLGLWKGEELARLGAVNTLFDEDKIVHNFSNMHSLFNAVPVPVSGTPEPLPEGPALGLPDGWEAWLSRRAVTAVVIVKDGAIVHEAYHQGTSAQDQRISWSMAKSYLSMLFGILVAEGYVDNLDAPVVDILPELAGTAYDGVTIRQLLQMTSGVSFDEDYLDFWSDINRMGRVLALGRSMDGFAASLETRGHAPGTHWQYVSIDTHVLGMILRRATGRTLPDLMGEHLFGPIGTHGAPHFLADGYGVAFALGGLNLTTRDYARMGEVVRNEGAFQGKQIVPADWMRESTAPSAPTEAGRIRYGYQWWLPADGRAGEILARGVYGQYVYIDKASGVVVAVNAVDRAFREDGAYDDALQMLRAVARAGGGE